MVGRTLVVWSLNLLEHAGPFQARTWIALLYFILLLKRYSGDGTPTGVLVSF
jgi:hypothetical protein